MVDLSLCTYDWAERQSSLPLQCRSPYQFQEAAWHIEGDIKSCQVRSDLLGPLRCNPTKKVDRSLWNNNRVVNTSLHINQLHCILDACAAKVALPVRAMTLEPDVTTFFTHSPCKSPPTCWKSQNLLSFPRPSWPLLFVPQVNTRPLCVTHILRRENH